MLYLQSGAVKLVRGESDGQEAILELAFAGSWLGTAAVITRTPSPIAAVTCIPTRIGRMEATTFRDLLHSNDALSRCIHEAHARELCRLAGWIGQLRSLSSRQRLQRVVRELIAVLRLKASGQGIRLRLPVKQWELARLVAITPEHLSRLLKEMEQEGVIHRDKGWVIVPDVQRLCPDEEYGAPWFSTPAAAANS